MIIRRQNFSALILVRWQMRCLLLDFLIVNEIEVFSFNNTQTTSGSICKIQGYFTIFTFLALSWFTSKIVNIVTYSRFVVILIRSVHISCWIRRTTIIGIRSNVGRTTYCRWSTTRMNKIVISILSFINITKSYKFITIYPDVVIFKFQIFFLEILLILLLKAF